LFFRKNKIATASLAGTRQLPWRGIIAVIIGLAVAAGSWWYLQQYVATHQKTEAVVVPAHDIPVFKVIEQSDLANRTIVLGAREPNAALNPQEIVGKMSSTMLYKGEQIRRERLSDPVTLNRQEVTVNIDPARVNGASPGDIVDVYWVQGESTPGALLAADAIVKAVADANGAPIAEGSAGVMAAAAQVGKGTPAMVTLYVMSGEIPQVVRGAAAGNKGVVLVRKPRPGGTATATSAIPETVQGQPKEQQTQKPPQG